LKILCLEHKDQGHAIILYIIVSNCSDIKLYCLISYDIGNNNLYIIYGIGTGNISFISDRECLCT
jgi:hypothetical protein